MKAIDLYLAIERNKNIPKKVVYKYKTYRYYPEYKQYYREEDGNMISLFLEANCDDRVYLIEDKPEEDKKIEKLEILPDNEHYSNKVLYGKINEIIDKVNGE